MHITSCCVGGTPYHPLHMLVCQLCCPCHVALCVHVMIHHVLLTCAAAGVADAAAADADADVDACACACGDADGCAANDVRVRMLVCACVDTSSRMSRIRIACCNCRYRATDVCNTAHVTRHVGNSSRATSYDVMCKRSDGSCVHVLMHVTRVCSITSSYRCAHVHVASPRHIATTIHACDMGVYT